MQEAWDSNFVSEIGYFEISLWLYSASSGRCWDSILIQDTAASFHIPPKTLFSIILPVVSEYSYITYTFVKTSLNKCERKKEDTCARKKTWKKYRINKWINNKHRTGKREGRKSEWKRMIYERRILREEREERLNGKKEKKKGRWK
jgi:hypothetical protein